MNLYNPVNEMDETEEWPGYKTYEQLGLLVLDGSSSMASVETASGMKKADAVEMACRELLDRLQNSDMADQFHLAAVTFDDGIATPLLPIEVEDLDESDLELDLLGNHGGKTAVGDALTRAGEIAEHFLQDEADAIPRYVVILLMSDGQNNSGADPCQVAQQLKSRFDQVKAHGPELTLAVAAYGDDADEATLGQIATDATFFKRVESGAELRDFFFSSVSRSLAGE